MPPKVQMKKELKVTAELGFPTNAYLGMIEWLKKNSYEVKKTNDWLYINPKTAHHAEVSQRRQAIEQRLTQVMMAVGDLRRDIELLKHDLRKFDNALEHHQKNDLDVLKSDYLDFIDVQTPNSMFKLARDGRFPTIVMDFFRIKSEKDIDDLKISKSEKSILQIKWKHFQQWRGSFAKGVEDRVRVLREEINSRQASLENYKASIRPYLEAIHKIRTSENYAAEFLSDPILIEGYMTSVAGVDLAVWKEISPKGEPRKWMQEDKETGFSHAIFFEVSIRRDQIIVKTKEMEGMKITIKSYLLTKEELEKKKKDIEDMEKALFRSLEEFRGEREIEKPKEKEMEKKEEGSILAPIKAAVDLMTGGLKASDATYGRMEKLVKEQTIALYDALKDLYGGMKLQRHPIQGR